MESSRPKVGSTTDNEKRPLRVLILDDEEPIRRIIKHALTRIGCEVETAANGRQGLQILLTKTFDVAVVDVRMQEMDGLAFVQEAKKIWPWQGVVIYSGFLDDRIVEIAEREGVRHILTKPIDMSKLIEAIKDEAEKQDSREKISAHQVPMSLISYQLNMMRHITRDMLHSHSLLNALSSLGDSITEALPCHMIGILAIEDDENTLLLSTKAPLPSTTTDRVQQHIIERYEALSGKTLKKDTLRIERKGPVSEHNIVRSIQSMASVPVLMGETVYGILTLASCDADAFDEVQITLLYHAAGNLSTMLGAFGEIRRMAIRDPLTGLYNRLQMNEELEKSWNAAQRYKKPMAVLLLDIDQFKSINDMWGHHTGDLLLTEFSDYLRNQVRTSDIICRYGGDEFVIILPRGDQQEATFLANRLQEALRNRRFLEKSNRVSITVSMGISVFVPDQSVFRKEDFLDRADTALYQAKKAGRDRFNVWQAPSRKFKPDGATALPSTTPTPSPSSQKGRILIVDDDESIQVLIKHSLEKEGYDAWVAGTIQEAKNQVESRSREIDLVLCDLSLPDGDGLELLKWCRAFNRELVTIVISGNVTADNVIMALRNGAFDFIQKPWSHKSLAAQIERAFTFGSLQKENARYHLHLEDMVQAKNKEISKALSDIKVAYDFTLETMVAMLDAREYETGQHSVRVRSLTLLLAREMGITGHELEEIGRGALLHDIGKIGIPDTILLKPAELTEDEWEVVRKHPEIGHRFLTNSSFLQTAAEIVLSHHERWDGQGYPRGLAGENITLGARIFSVIDSYDAMRSARIYKKSICTEEAVNEIKRSAGKQFDPKIVEAFLNCIDEIEDTGRWSTSFV